MNKLHWILEFAAGAAIGLLVGLIAGLSISPVTQTVLGSLSAGLLILLGLKQSKESTQEAAHTIRILGFGLSCSIALILGVFLRTHSTLSPDLAVQKQRLVDAKVFSQDQIDQVLLLTNFGVHSSEASTPKGNDMQNNNQSGESNSGEGRAKSKGSNDEHHTVEDTSSPTAALASAGLLRAGSEHFCDIARRRQFKDLNSYLNQVRRLDPKLYSILQSAPEDYREQLSQSLDGYLCP